MSDQEVVALHSTTKERYLNYALSVITSRALPDVRDGLKPVQRRILYGLNRLRLTPDARYRKSAQVVGEVMGKYHPHGDSAIYDAMVRMAQWFSLRYTLVDGHGNFGSIDGDGAAAMRYTEVRMAPLAQELLGDLSDRIVPYRPTYDASNTEPIVLPAAFPALLANGATGIAVGMATNIPPHNLRELLDGCVAMIDDPKLSLDALLEYIPAPDFPTGGQILNTPEELASIYETGRGPIELRGEFEVEREGRKQRIVIKSVPYTVNKAQLVERIADHVRVGKIPQIVDVRDESTEEIRVVLDLKAGAKADAAMAYIYKHTPLQSRFHVNLTALVPTEVEGVGAPRVLGLKETLRYFLDFRYEVITKRLMLRLEKLEEEIHILEAFEKIFDHLDEAIALIRASRDRKEAFTKLSERFELDAIQTNAVLDTRLYKLAQMEIVKIRAELENKREEAAKIRALLADEAALWALVREELVATANRFGDYRRTQIGGRDLTQDYSAEDYIVDEDVFVIVTREGWFKRQRSYSDISTIRVRDGDEVGWVMEASTRRSLILFSDRGSAYTILVDKVPATTGHGDPVQAHFDFDDGERVVCAVVTDPEVLPELQAVAPPQSALPLEVDAELEEEAPEHSIVALSKRGQALRHRLASFEAVSTRNGRTYMKLQDDEDRVIGVEVAGGNEMVSLISRESRALTFGSDEITLLKSAGKGVKAVSLDKKDVVIGFTLVRKSSEGLEVFTSRGRRVVVSPRRFPPVARGSRGRLLVRRGQIAEVSQHVVEWQKKRGEE